MTVHQRKRFVPLLIFSTSILFPLFLFTFLQISPISEVPDFGTALRWIAAQQRYFYELFSDALRTLSAEGRWSTAGILIGASFLYGIFHAAGPGHGKVILSGYLLSQKQRVSSGVLLAVAGSFCQGATAILLVYGLTTLLRFIPVKISEATDWSERVSFALIAMIGVILMVRTFGHRRVSSPQSVGEGIFNKSNDRTRKRTKLCFHPLTPTAAQMDKAGSSLRMKIGVILSVGLRPCSGAIIVLIAARAFQLPLIGIFSVLIMSAGTSLAIAALAFTVVHTRRLTASYLGIRTPRAALITRTCAFAGGFFMLLLGVSLLMSSFAPQHPLGL